MKLTPTQLRTLKNRCVTLLGMSGVGKTRLATMLRRHNWFHYSVDYRIGTRYLGEPILDNIKRQAMRVPFLRDLLRSDSIYISNNITVDNLHPVSSFLGMVGDPERGGLSLEEFKRRQALYRQAVAAAAKDVPEFISKSREIYGYRHFVNDAGASLCEIDDPEIIDLLARHTLILYIRATQEEEEELRRRADAEPRPISYRQEFLEEQLPLYMREYKIPYVAMVDPGDFARWVFPKLLHSRLPLYEQIAAEHGYHVTTDELKQVEDEADFLRLLEQAVDRGR